METLRNKLTITNLSLICLLLFSGVLITDLHKNLKMTKSIVSEQASKITYYRNANGELVATKEAAEAKISEIKQAHDEMLKKIQKDFSVKPRNIRAYTEAAIKAEGSGKSQIIWKHDTVNDVQKRFSPFTIVSQDGYLSYQADAYDSLNVPFVYEYSDTIKHLFHVEGKWFQRKKLYASAMLSNPKATVVNSNSFLVSQCRDKRFGIGPAVGVGVLLENSTFKTGYFIGIGLHYDIIKF